MSAHGVQPTEWRRLTALWLCLALFVSRVIGQAEVLLRAPSWLPPFPAWESGLIPVFWVTRSITRKRLQAFACVYFAVMLCRLTITAAIPPHGLVERGLIPVVAHWSLAGFTYLTARTPRA